MTKVLFSVRFALRRVRLLRSDIRLAPSEIALRAVLEANILSLAGSQDSEAAAYGAASAVKLMAGLELGVYRETVLGQEVSGDTQALVQGLYVARRGYAPGREPETLETWTALWNFITQEETP